MTKTIIALLLLASTTAMAQVQYRPYNGSSAQDQYKQQLDYQNALRQQSNQQMQDQQQLQQQQNQYNQNLYNQRQMEQSANQWLKPKY